MANVNGAPKPSAAGTEPHAQPAGQRLSFASVAALALSQSPEPPAMSAVDPTSRKSVNRAPANLKSGPSLDDHTESLRESVARLNIRSSGPIIASTDSDDQTPVSESLRFDDERTHLSSISNPTVSTDVRSVVSGTTFAMDEKESIRPDESASIKAADEDDSNSGGTSGGPQSVAGSEAGKAFRDQFHEISGAKMALPLTTNLVESMPDETGHAGASATTMAYVCPPPDEKLLEALQSHRDRIFLLQMEHQRTNAPSTAGGSVRLGKTDGSRLAPPLSEIANQQTIPVAAIAPQPTLKIMRRSDKLANATSQTNSISNAGSGTQSPNADSDSVKHSSPGMDTTKDNFLSKDIKRPTLEEREAKYNARREELYKDIPEQSVDNSNSASRASSMLGSQKSKKRQPKNDDFEPRSSYTNMGYGGSAQQNFGYGHRPGQVTYPVHQGGQAMNHSAIAQDYSQGNFGHQGYVPDANKTYNSAYDPNQTQNYYIQGYQGYVAPVPAGYHAFGTIPSSSSQPGQYQNQQQQQQQQQQQPMVQRPAPSPQYPNPASAQQVPQHFVPQYEHNFQSYGSAQMMYPPGFPAPQQQQGASYRPAQIGQYGSPAQQNQHPTSMGHMMYPDPHATHSRIGMPSYTSSQQGAAPYHPAQPSSFNGPASISGQHLPGMQSQPAPYKSHKANGQKGKKGATGNTKSPVVPGAHPSHWNGPNRGQMRDNSRVEEFVVPRQDEFTSQQAPMVSLSSSELNKYDTSSLPPKPPKPAANPQL